MSTTFAKQPYNPYTMEVVGDKVGIGTSSPQEKLAVSGNVAVSGSIEIGNQTGTGQNLAITRRLMDFDVVDFDKISLKDDFVGGADGDTTVGQLNWQRTSINGAGTVLVTDTVPGFGVVALRTAAAYRGIQFLQWDYSATRGQGGFRLSDIANSTTKIAFRFKVSSLNCRIDIGFQEAQAPSDTHFAADRKFTLNYTKAPVNWTANTSINLNEYRKPTVSNGRRYYASIAGTTGSTEPVWPTNDGAVVNDGTVRWREAGREGSATFNIIQHTSAGETGGVIVDTGISVATNTWYSCVIEYLGADQWRFTINGTPTLITTTGSLGTDYTPIFAIINSDNTQKFLSIDYWGMTSRVTR